MVDVERLSFRLDHPHGSGGICEMMFVEVENRFVSSEDLRFVVHDSDHLRNFKNVNKIVKLFFNQLSHDFLCLVSHACVVIVQRKLQSFTRQMFDEVNLICWS